MARQAEAPGEKNSMTLASSKFVGRTEIESIEIAPAAAHAAASAWAAAAAAVWRDKCLE